LVVIAASISYVSMSFAWSYAWSFWKGWIVGSTRVENSSDPDAHPDLLPEQTAVKLRLKAFETGLCRCGRSECSPLYDCYEIAFGDGLPNLPDHSRYLTCNEANEIIQQFGKVVLRPGHQVMWCGVPRTWAQYWADHHGLQTLSTAMGPLMDTKHHLCRKRTMTPTQWSNYVRGASLLFASCLPKGHVITLLTKPPPARFNPTGQTTYQQLEEPILKGSQGGESVLRIEIVHFTVMGLEGIRYQAWPLDEVDTWIERSKASLPLRQYTHLKDRR